MDDAVATLDILLTSDGERVGIQLDDGIDAQSGFRARLIELLDTLNVRPCELFRGQLSGGHHGLELSDGALEEREVIVLAVLANRLRLPCLRCKRREQSCQDENCS